MTLTKAQSIESIQNQTGFPKNRSSEIIETLFYGKDAVKLGDMNEKSQAHKAARPFECALGA